MPTEDGPGGAKGDVGGGAGVGARPISSQWMGSVGGARGDSCTCGQDRG
jgi:hypothetical protein